MTRISLILALHIRKTFLDAKDLFEKSKNDEDRFGEDITIPLLRLKGYGHVTDLHRTGKSSEQGKDIIWFEGMPSGKKYTMGLNQVGASGHRMWKASSIKSSEGLRFLSLRHISVGTFQYITCM